MRIHWFSPLSPERTDIGHFTLRVCEELAKHCDLTLWTHPQHFSGPQQPSWRKRYKAFPYSEFEQQLEALNRADAIFYNIGNNAAFHREILDAMRRVPGVAIMHDRCLFECISSVYREKPHGERLFSQLMEVTYGPEAKSDNAAWLKGDRSLDQLATQYPFDEHAALGAWGTIHHSDPVDDQPPSAPAPHSWTLSLPYPAEPLLNAPKLRERDGCLHCLLFGYLGGPNRRLAETLQALKAYPQKDRIRLHLAGEVHENFKIDSLLAKLGLSEQVTREGFLPENELDQLLSGSDLVINLRFPTRGEASGSLLRAWNQAAPSAVTNRGAYAQLPDDVVWKVDPEQEASQLMGIWDSLLLDPQAAVEKGQAGRRLLQRKHSVESYVASLLEIAATPGIERGPTILPLLEQRYALFAQQLFQLSPEDVVPVLSSLDRELETWFR
ncbi:hypothetical protein IEN85_04290 [Pelagicoccus sp. NFK12]|uniref:Glycosyl transferase family 1 domain-containing protein n=1 Tax=Pelagicoccus enzymogenes TaxID=2773457 RepID=A0A927F863_9BACT|nr:glycosyltransferase [Pelagicoccus enzymogenes]MBD5778698.1 hypothetical protein [Pelagicoccus enzymogenes]